MIRCVYPEAGSPPQKEALGGSFNLHLSKKDTEHSAYELSDAEVFWRLGTTDPGCGIKGAPIVLDHSEPVAHIPVDLLKRGSAFTDEVHVRILFPVF